MGEKVFTSQDAKRAYQRAWYAKNRDKVKASKERYWQKKAEALNAAAKGNEVAPQC